jgi:N-acetyl-beta-hexosaminidase
MHRHRDEHGDAACTFMIDEVIVRQVERIIRDSEGRYLLGWNTKVESKDCDNNVLLQELGQV